MAAVGLTKPWTVSILETRLALQILAAIAHIVDLVDTPGAHRDDCFYSRGTAGWKLKRKLNRWRGSGSLGESLSSAVRSVAGRLQLEHHHRSQHDIVASQRIENIDAKLAQLLADASASADDFIQEAAGVAVEDGLASPTTVEKQEFQLQLADARLATGDKLMLKDENVNCRRIALDALKFNASSAILRQLTFSSCPLKEKNGYKERGARSRAEAIGHPWQKLPSPAEHRHLGFLTEGELENQENEDPGSTRDSRSAREAVLCEAVNFRASQHRGDS
ncbi:unnamed protein product [Symbiodinium sp. CCMP2592]|nr:unnamed protein product [Symbiodinium sp. CCMP2592]